MDYKIDNSVKVLMDNIAHNFQNILGNNLIGIYIHGSVAFGCFNPECSDIDFIVVTEREPDFDTKKNIIQFMLKLNENAPAKGFEMSFVLKKHCTDFVYPTPYQLHFSASHKNQYLIDIDSHIHKMRGTDKDLAAHFTIINHTGITWYGADKNDIFSPVSSKYYLDSIKFDIENAGEDIIDNPVYIILNLCRVLAYVQQGKILSKAEGGEWGIKNISKYHQIIRKATDFYLYGKPGYFDQDDLAEFARFMTDKIFE